MNNKKYLAKIIAKDPNGIQIISACCSGGKVKVDEIKFLKKNKIFLLLIERFNKEKDKNQKIKSICKFEFVDMVKSKNIEHKMINLKNVESSPTKYNPLKATPVEGSNKARKNAIIMIKIPNLFVFLKLFSLKKNMSNIINIKVEQKIKISGIAKSIPSMPGICK